MMEINGIETFSILGTFIFALLGVKILEPLAIDFGLIDKPGPHKIYKGNIPLVGGLSIFLSVLLASYLWLPDSVELRIYLIASSLLVFIGAIDDKYDLSVRIRLVGQLLIASLMIYGMGTYISQFGDILGIGNIDIGYSGVIFTYLSILVMINAYNMIDGSDGILGVQSLITFLSLALLFYLDKASYNVTFPLMISSALIPYLLANLSITPNSIKKIYMGDAGSMFIGLTIIWLLAKGTQGEDNSFQPVTALWITALPLMDMLTVVIRRIQKKQSPFKPGRDHFHHLCIKLGLSTYKTLIITSSISIFCSLIGLLGHIYAVSESVMFCTFILVFIIYFYCVTYVSSKLNTQE